VLKIAFQLHKCFLDILRCVSVVVANLSSWRCGNT